MLFHLILICVSIICVHDEERSVILADTWCGVYSGLSALIWQPSAAELKVRNGGSLGQVWGGATMHIWLSASRDEWLWDNRPSAAGRKMILWARCGSRPHWWGFIPAVPATSTCHSTCGSTLEQFVWVDATIEIQRKLECFIAPSLKQMCDVLRLVSFIAFWNNHLFSQVRFATHSRESWLKEQCGVSSEGNSWKLKHYLPKTDSLRKKYGHDF